MSVILYMLAGDVQNEVYQAIFKAFNISYQPIVLEVDSPVWLDLKQTHKDFTLPCLVLNDFYYMDLNPEALKAILHQEGFVNTADKETVFSEERRHQRLARENTQRFF